MANSKLSIVFAGGGTAGHINPLLATAKAVQKLMPEVKINVVGSEQGLETELVPAAGYQLQLIDKVPFPRRVNRSFFQFPFAFRHAIKQAENIITEADADVVVGFGGYISTPVYLAARKRRIPIVIHEANARYGLANKLGARWAKLVAITFPSTELKARKGETLNLGLPMREDITRLAQDVLYKQSLREKTAREYGFTLDKPILVVTGGSSGAVHVNETVAQSAQVLIEGGIQVLHITGKNKSASVLETIGKLSEHGYRVIEYLNGMESAYSLADCVITRSGAGMVAEVSALGLPTIFVPLPIGNGEQARNAHDVVEAGGALLVTDADFTPQWLEENLLPLFSGNTLAKMADSASRVSPLDAAQQLAQYIVELGK